MTPEEFAGHCRQVSRDMRRLPVEVKRALRERMKPDVAEPLAQDIRAAGAGSYGTRVAGTVRVRANADPTVVVGGAKRVASGGARGRDLVFGTEFGGGKRLTAVARANGHRGYRRYSTNQFRRHRAPFIFPTIGRTAGHYLERWADVVTEIIDERIGRG